MKRKFTITFKFLFLVVLLTFLLTFVLIENLLMDKDALVSNNVRMQLDTYELLFDSYFGNISRLSDDNYTDKTIKYFMNKTEGNVLSFDIVLIQNSTPPYRLIIAESSEKERVNSTNPQEPSNKDLHIQALKNPTDYQYKRIGNTNKYIIVSAFYSSDVGGYIGTYELVLDLQDSARMYEVLIGNTTNAALFSFGVLIIVTIFIVYFLIQKPLSKLKSATVSLGRGNLDVRADVKSRDEFGDLSDAFNQMAKDLKKSRDKIEEYNRILKKIIDQKDEFIGQLGHDLKNPMQPLVGLLPLLIEKEKDPKSKEMLEIMNSNVEYMQDLIFDTLKLAKLRSDNIEFNFEKIDLKELSDKIEKSQKTMLEEKNIKIVNKIKDSIYVYADSLRLSEVFKNLINNSVKYTKESGGTITLDAEYENKDIVKISIKDTGIGMTEEQIKKVFDEFYKADRQTSDYHSTGLGLAICKRIVEKHNGKIWVESEGIGKGSRFYFTIQRREIK